MSGESTLFCLPDRPWFYAAEAGGIQNTAERTVAAAVPGKRNFMRCMEVRNVAAAVDTEVVFLDGPSGAVLMRLAPLDPPLRTSVGRALVVQCLTTASQTYVNAQGWVGS